MQKKIKLQDELKTLFEQQKELINSDDSGSAESREKIEKIDTRLDEIEAEIRQIEAFEARERKMLEDRQKEIEQRQKHESAEVDVEAYWAAMRSYLMHGKSNLSREELNALKAVENRNAQATSPGADGGFLVPTGLSSELEKFLLAFGGIYEVARKFPTAAGNPFDWPTVDDTSNMGAIVAENAAAGNAPKVVFGKVTFGAHKYGSGVIEVSRELIQDSLIPIEPILAELIAERVQRRMATLFATGTGSAQPQGLITGASASGVTQVAATAVTFDNLIDLEHSVNSAYRLNAMFGFNDLTLRALRKLKDNDGQYIWTAGDVRTGAPATLLGRRYFVDDAIPNIGANARSIVFGDMTKYIIRPVTDGILRRSEEYGFDSDQIAMAYWQRFDAKVINSQAIKVLVHPAS